MPLREKDRIGLLTSRSPDYDVPLTDNSGTRLRRGT